MAMCYALETGLTSILTGVLALKDIGMTNPGDLNQRSFPGPLTDSITTPQLVKKPEGNDLSTRRKGPSAR